MGNRQRRLHFSSPGKRGRAKRRLLIERLGQRRLLAAITGTVFEDVDDSFRREPAETALAERLIYLDSNDNAVFDGGERYAITDAEGGFAFPELAAGTYSVRLFDGTSSQRQTFPVDATVREGSVAVEAAHQLVTSESGPIALTASEVVWEDLSTGTRQELSFGSSLVKMQTLPGGDLLVIGGKSNSETAWRVSPTSQTASPIDLANAGAPSEGSSVVWSDLALDGQGRGVLLQQSSGESAVRAVDASDPEAGIEVSTTQTTVPSGARALTSQSGARSVIAWAGSDGLSVALWSNLTASPIDASSTGSESASMIEGAVQLAEATELLAFDDDAGLLAVRTEQGGVELHDVDGNFAPLHSLPDVTGPVAFDTTRDLLMTLSPVDSTLKLIDLRDGSLIADWNVDLSSIGDVTELMPVPENDSVVALGVAGMTEISFKNSTAHTVHLADDFAEATIEFGLQVSGDNTLPIFLAPLAWTIAEDTDLNVSAPGALADTVDADGDSYVLLAIGSAEHGSANISPDGAVNYSPDPDFAGTDRLSVALHDGRGMTRAWFDITVTPVADPPTALKLNIPPISEHAQPGTIVGTYEVVDADAENNHSLSLSDPRLRAGEGQIYFDNGELNYESQSQFPLSVTVSDPETGSVLSKESTVSVSDANDPITRINPQQASVSENDPGALIAELVVEDEDAGAAHTFSVDDERFIVESSELRLAEGVALDYEKDPTVVVEVTASDLSGGGELSQEITITVEDLPEQPESIELDGDSVVEFEPGAEVGEVMVDGAAAKDKYALSVDDSRFEIAGGMLKLVDGIWVERANQSQIQLEITAEDVGQGFDPIHETFVIDVVENATPYHNDGLPYDVDGNDDVTAVDALTIINYLNTYGPGPVGHGDPGFDYDVNGDGMVTSLDALMVINEINRIDMNSDGPAVGGEKGEGELPRTDSSKLIADDSPANQRSTDVAITQLGGQLKQVADSRQQPASHSRLDPADHAAPGESRETYAAKVDDTLRLLSERTS